MWFLIHLLNVRGLVSSGFQQWRNVFVTEMMTQKKRSAFPVEKSVLKLRKEFKR